VPTTFTDLIAYLSLANTRHPSAKSRGEFFSHQTFPTNLSALTQ